MATVEHCLYCWESLAAALERRDSFSLDQVQKSYATYLAALSSAQASSSTAKPSKKIPALRRLLAGSGNPSSSSSSASSSTSLGSTGSSSTSLSSNTVASSVSSSSSSSSPAASTARPRTQIDLVTDPEAQYPLFVTWDKRSTSRTASRLPSSEDDDDDDSDVDWQLRGCIGTFHDGDPLSETLSEYSLTSALRDTRFPRVALRELPALRCTVTLLTNFEDCGAGPEAYDDWEIGVHGIRIKFTLDGRRYGATYLPSVAEEQGWTKEETMVSLMRKAGWEGRRDSWRAAAARGGMKVERYRGDKEEVAFREYKTWREWASQNWEMDDDDE